ncbi:MAG: DUF4838 domain-containing protein, partial [Leadbetterella sp.]
KIAQKACQCTIQKVDEKTYSNLPALSSKIVLGPSNLTDKLGYPNDLKPEEFRIVKKGNIMVILAKDIEKINPKYTNIYSDPESENSRVTQWATGFLLDRYFGVKWLWPGDLGTHTPKLQAVTIPEMDYRYQPRYEKRNFNIIKSTPENQHWIAYNHFGGSRIDYHFNHSFRKNFDNGDWWNEFKDTKPTLLAQSPQGGLQEPPKKDFFKICTSNPESVDEIVKRWEAAGMPVFWDITPNDGKGFCTCDRCMAQDKELGGKSYKKEEIWNGYDFVNLTDRHVWQWNQIAKRLNDKKQGTKVGVYYYSQYREPPISQQLQPNIVGEMVHSLDFNQWLKWQKAGAKEIGLRPNWLYMGACGPHVFTKEVGSYIEKARDNGMILINMDSFQEYWATQGINYYLIGRLVARPDLNTAQIIDEYCSTFGKAQNAIKEYIQFWEDYHVKVNYNIPVGGSSWREGPSIYKDVCKKEFNDIMHPLKGHWMTLPYIYKDSVMTIARKHLDVASKKTKDKVILQRIDFLRDGLRMVEKGIAYSLAYRKKDLEAKKVTFKALQDFTKEMERKHGYWNASDIHHLKWWGLVGKEVDSSQM